MEELMKCLNQVATYLCEGERWHSRVANELRKMPNKRGYARMHDDQSVKDGERLIALTKLFRDNMKYSPKIDMSYVAKTEDYTLDSFEDFKAHFDFWINREKMFKDILVRAVELIRNQDPELYIDFFKMAGDIKKEFQRAEWIKWSLADSNWEKHHCAVVSKWIHDQTESNPGCLDLNIG